MDTKTGKIHMNPSDDEIIAKQLTMLERGEFNLVKDLPEEERPVVLALRRYCDERARLGRTGIPIQEKTAFRLGFQAGRDSK